MPKLDISLRCLVRASWCASSEQRRFYLNGVFVEPAPTGGVICVGLDGNRMAVVHDPEGRAEGSHLIGMAGDWRDQGAALRKLANRREASPRFVLAADATAQVIVGENVLWRSPGSVVIDGEFPAWRRVLPKFDHRSTPCWAAYNAEYLAAFIKVNGDSRSSPGIAVFSVDPAGPALVRGEAKDWFGVVMPWRAFLPAPELPPWAGESLDATPPAC